VARNRNPQESWRKTLDVAERRDFDPVRRYLKAQETVAVQKARTIMATSDPKRQQERIRSFTLPYKASVKIAARRAMLNARQRGEKRGDQILRKAGVYEPQAFRKRLLRGVGVSQRTAKKVLAVQEAVGLDETKRQLEQRYRTWADTLGDDLWEQRVGISVQAIIDGLNEGLPVDDYAIYIDAAADTQVPAKDALKVNGTLKAGYERRVIPGVATRIQQALKEHREAALERIARTETSRAVNEGMVDRFADNEAVRAFEYVAILDDRTSDKCEALDGQVIAADDPELASFTPPNHVNCRSTMSPIVVTDDDEVTWDKDQNIEIATPDGGTRTVRMKPRDVNPDILDRVKEVDASGQVVTKSDWRVPGGRPTPEGFTPKTPEEALGEFLGDV